MQVIPSINTTDFEVIKKQMREIQGLGAEWAHIDVTDGKFSKTVLWNNPKELEASDIKYQVNIEVHLMIDNPDEVLGEWLRAGVKRTIIHLEAAKDVEAMKRQCEAVGAELALAVNPDTPIENLLLYRGWIKQILILAVHPGLPGQKFLPDQLGKIRALRVKMSNAKIEVDGGINLETAKLCKEAGAEILVSASYIFNSADPKVAYEQLRNV